MKAQRRAVTESPEFKEYARQMQLHVQHRLLRMQLMAQAREEALEAAAKAREEALTERLTTQHQQHQQAMLDLVRRIQRHVQHRMLCRACARQRKTTVLPCGHFCLCDGCSATVTRCPVCQAGFGHVTRIHM